LNSQALYCHHTDFVILNHSALRENLWFSFPKSRVYITWCDISDNALQEMFFYKLAYVCGTDTVLRYVVLFLLITGKGVK